jgi:hypothetical protein
MPALEKHPAVDAEVHSAATWYDEQRLGLGDQFIYAVQFAVRAIEAAPIRNAIRFLDIRRARLSRFPYSVWFFVAGERVWVLHNKRSVRALLENRRTAI